MTHRRFITRRGKPAEIFSNNGTNCVAAAKDIGNLIKQMPLIDFASQQAMEYRFLPG